MITSIIQSSSDDLRRNTLSCDRAIKKSKTSPITLYFFVSCSVRGKHSLLVMYNWAASAFNYKWLCPFERANESPLTQHIPNGFADLSVRPWARPPGERQTVRNRRVNIAVFRRQGEKWMFLDNSGVMSSGSSSCRDELLFKVTFWRVGFTSAHWLRFTKEKGETFNLPHLKKVSVCSCKKKKKKAYQAGWFHFCKQCLVSFCASLRSDTTLAPLCASETFIQAAKLTENKTSRSEQIAS